jgi:hypothetical protein
MVLSLTRQLPLFRAPRRLFLPVFLRNHDLVTWM